MGTKTCPQLLRKVKKITSFNRLHLKGDAIHLIQHLFPRGPWLLSQLQGHIIKAA